MTTKQYAFIYQAKQVIEDIRSLSVHGQEVCGNYDNAYYKLCDIEDICNEFLKDFGDTKPN